MVRQLLTNPSHIQDQSPETTEQSLEVPTKLLRINKSSGEVILLVSFYLKV